MSISNYYHVVIQYRLKNVQKNKHWSHVDEQMDPTDVMQMSICDIHSAL